MTKKTKIPNGMTEGEVIAIVENIANILSQKFSFGYFTKEDIKQEAFYEVWKDNGGLDKYDGRRPLANFLYVHIKNRLYNLKRNKFQRPDKPCLNCPLKAYDLNLPSECKLYINKMECEYYNSWASRNIPKKNIMNCIDIHNVDDTEEKSMSFSEDNIGDIEYKRIISIIDEKLPMYLRSYYLKLKANQKIPRIYKEELQSVIADILEKAGVSIEY